MKEYVSWGRYPIVKQQVIKLNNRNSSLPITTTVSSLPYGQGRSYGDCCLNDLGQIISTEYLDHFINFNTKTGILKCESGVTLAQILDLIVPQNWFLPVTPGTRFVTVGGAIANDVHGKNHHLAGTFGCHLIRFELIRSDHSRIICSETENSELFRASIGGLGLTGLVSWAEIQLKPITSAYIEQQSIKYTSLDEFLSLSEDSDKDWEYTVAWLDCFTSKSSHSDTSNDIKGIFFRGRHGEKPLAAVEQKQSNLVFPFYAPSFTLNRFTIKTFNALYYAKQTNKSKSDIIHYQPFFYPLDGIRDWYKLYGKQGFFQFQCVIPINNIAALNELLTRISLSGQGSFLSVLKLFGSVTSPGMLSFPRKGITLALDFANKGSSTMNLLSELESIVVNANGAIYPAKDALMHAQNYQKFYPGWEDFSDYIDPAFSSSFWRRVSKQSGN